LPCCWLAFQRLRRGAHDGPPISPCSKSGAFKLGCSNPRFPAPAPSRTLIVDSKCGLDGNGTGAEAAQNDAKNDFCASGTPQPITIADMRYLQTKVEQNTAINFGPSGPTTDRGPLKALGEDNLVTIEKAYVLISRQEGRALIAGDRDPSAFTQFGDLQFSRCAI
jgi:hypothetical protein